MANDFSDYLEAALLNATLRATTYTSPANVYLSLHTGDPGDTGASECAGGSYARQAITFAAPSGGACASNASQTFSSMPAATVTYAGVWDASSAGNFLYRINLTASKTVDAGDSISFGSGQVTVTLT